MAGIFSLFKGVEKRFVPELFEASAEITRIPVFVVGTGRCGTHFLEAIMREDPDVNAMHTDRLNAAADSFLRYCLWYGLAVDLAPARDFRRRLVLSAQKQNRTYFESNAYLSLAAGHLHSWYGANIILLVRRPQDVVNSHLVKGWYAEEPLRGDVAMAPGFSPEMETNHFFGRILPTGVEYNGWQKLSRVGKVSWWVNALNMRVLEILDGLPSEVYRVLKVEELGYEKYLDLQQMVNGRTPMTQKRFNEIRSARPGKGKSTRTVSDWTDTEWQHFLVETKPLHDRLGYEPRRSR